MNTDIRISVGLTSHPKTVKLMRRCGDRSFYSLISLWVWAAQYRPDGVLSGMDKEDIEISAGWQGEEGKLVDNLISLRFIDDDNGNYSLHDWADHNLWAAKAEERGDSGRFSRMAKTHPKEYEKLKSEGKTAITKEEYLKITTTQKRTVNEPLTNVNESVTPAPTPSPSPTPSLNLNNNIKAEPKTSHPVDNSQKEKTAFKEKPKEQFKTETEMQELQGLVNQIVVKYPRLPIYKFLQSHTRDHPQAMLVTLKQFLNAKIEVPEVPIMMKWLEISITEKNKTYNARDSEQQNNDFKADRNPLSNLVNLVKSMPDTQLPGG